MRTSLRRAADGPATWVKHAERPAEMARIRNEAAVLGAIRHPNVVELAHAGEDHVATVVAGRSDLTTSPPRDLAEASHLATALRVIVTELHAAGWAHGDLRPDHVVRGPGGRLTLCSFGRARPAGHPGAAAADRAALARMIRRWEAELGRSGDRGHRRRLAHELRLVDRPPPGPGPPPRRTRARRVRQLRSVAGRFAVFAMLAVAAWVVPVASMADGPAHGAATAAWWGVRVGALYGLAVSGAWLAVLAADRPGAAAHLRRLAPARFHRWLFGVALVSAAVRVVPGVPPAPPPPTPTTDAPPDPTSTTVTPSTTVPPATAPPATVAPEPLPPSPPPAVWVVRPGDHLWLIAEEVLARRSDRDPTDDEVGRYWRTLVDQNRHRLVDPGNPDLVLPGQRFVLPP